jgi:hypothetical protein
MVWLCSQTGPRHIKPGGQLAFGKTFEASSGAKNVKPDIGSIQTM